MADVFISYPQAAVRPAEAFSNALEAKGLKSWYASRDLSSGDQSPTEIEDAIKAADAAVFLITPDAEPSSWMRQEYSTALEAHWCGKPKLLIPVLIGKETKPPDFLRQWESVRIEKKAGWAKAADKVYAWLQRDESQKNLPSSQDVAKRRDRFHSIDEQLHQWHQAGEELKHKAKSKWKSKVSTLKDLASHNAKTSKSAS